MHCCAVTTCRPPNLPFPKSPSPTVLHDHVSWVHRPNTLCHLKPILCRYSFSDNISLPPVDNGIDPLTNQMDSHCCTKINYYIWATTANAVAILQWRQIAAEHSYVYWWLYIGLYASLTDQWILSHMQFRPIPATSTNKLIFTYITEIENETRPILCWPTLRRQ
jgi:hypothetical protein